MNTLTQSLWGDESFTAVAVQNSFSRMMEIVAADTAPPGYYILLFVWTRIFGHSEVSLRSLSLLLYAGTVITIYLIAKHIWGRKTGVIALVLALANPFLFPFAFESRMYAILFFTVTLSFYFFIKKNLIGYVLAGAAAIYSQHYAVLALFFQFGWRLFTIGNLKKNWLNLIKPYIFIGILYLPWLYPLYKQVTMVSGGFWLGKPTVKDFFTLYLKYFRGGEFLFKLQEHLIFVTAIILILKNWGKKIKSNLLLLGWALVPVLLGWIISQGKSSIFYDRYLIFIIPALILIMAGGWRKISLFFILLYSLPLLYVNFHYFTHPQKRPFRQLSEYIHTNTKSSDFLINYNGSAHHLWESKYYKLNAPLYVPGGDLPYYVGTAQMTDKDIIKTLPNQKIGVISSENPQSIFIENFMLGDCHNEGSLSFCWFEPKL